MTGDGQKMAVGPAPLSNAGKETPCSFYALLASFCNWEEQVTLVPHEEPHHFTHSFFNLLESSWNLSYSCGDPANLQAKYEPARS